MVDANAEQRHARRRRRLPLERAGRSLHQAGTTQVQGPRAPGGGDRRPDDVGDGRPSHRSFQCRSGHRSRRSQRELRPRAEPLEARAGPRGRVGPRGPPRGDGRVRDRRAGHLPGHHRPGRPRSRPDRGQGAVSHGRRDLQRRHGRDPGDIEQPPPPDAPHAGLGHRPLHRGSRARRGPRDARREHDVRSPRPRRPRSREPCVGSVLGGWSAASSSQCTSTSAPASRR